MITWQTPTNNQVIEQDTPSSIELNVKVVDTDGTIDSFVLKYNETEIIATKDGDNFMAEFMPSSFGSYTLVAIATDDQGTTTEQSITFTIVEQGTNTAPEIAMITPLEPIEQSQLSSIAIEAGIKDDGSVATVEFMVDNEAFEPIKVGDIYILNWLPPAYGTFVLKVYATDNQGLTSNTVVDITIKERCNIADSCNAIDAWSAGKVYATPQKIKYQGKIYKNKWWTRGEIPGNTSVWEFIENCKGDCDENQNTTCNVNVWTNNAIYLKGDQAYYEHKIYEAKWWTQNENPKSSIVWKFVSDCVPVNPAIDGAAVVLLSTHVKDEAQFKIKGAKKSIVQIRMYDFSGKLIHTFVNDFPGGEGMITQDVSALQNGLYIYKVVIDKNNFTGRLIKD